MKDTRIKKINIFLAALLVFTLMCLAFGGGYLTYYLTLSKSQKTLNWLADMIDRNYLIYDEETGEVRNFTADDYAKAITNGLLDVYSEYYTAEEYKDVIRTSQGNNYGIGVSFLIGGDLNIFSVSGNSPAYNAGVKAGGKVTSVIYDKTVTEVATVDEFFTVLGEIPRETDFKLTVQYADGERIFTLQKRSYVESYVFYSDSEKGYDFRSEYGETPIGAENTDGKLTALAADTGYIKYTSFMYSSVEQFAAAYEYMITRGRTKLILDLRNNGGGYLDVLQGIAEYLIDNGGKDRNLVTLARNKNGKEDFYYTVKNRYNNQITEIAVLANRNTASASECLIGAMLTYGSLDYEHYVATKGADDVGRSYGKGIMQTTFPHLTVGDALKLTTAYIYWPDEVTNIHGKGIIATPDNAIASGGDVDNQLLRAVEILS